MTRAGRTTLLEVGTTTRPTLTISATVCRSRSGRPVASAATWQSFGQWLATHAAAGEFSGTALVARNGRVLLDAGYGQADQDRHVANTAQTTFCVASIGKLFTAVAIAQLAQDHKTTPTANTSPGLPPPWPTTSPSPTCST